MWKKTILLGLCVTLALLVGCGRSKPATSKVDAEVKMEEGSSAPPDALPPKTTAPPTASAPRTVAPTQQGGVQFGPLPPNSGRDPWGDAEREKIRNARRLQAEGMKPAESQPDAQDTQSPAKTGQ